LLRRFPFAGLGKGHFFATALRAATFIAIKVSGGHLFLQYQQLMSLHLVVPHLVFRIIAHALKVVDLLLVDWILCHRSHNCLPNPLIITIY
jgi:hypothetical protein